MEKNFTSTHESGLFFEQRAQEYLENKGYQFIAKNFRWKGGETDLIFNDPAGSGPQGTIVFVEVRSSSEKSNFLRNSISFKKRRRLIHAAHMFLYKMKYRSIAFRFDFIWIEKGEVEHWKNVMVG